ncbi:hypothetical protein E4T56_gene13743, partial [Termitomyces sp. T112]
LNLQKSLTPTGPLFNALDTFGFQVSARGRVAVSWRKDGFNANIAANYVGSYLNNATITVAGVKLPDTQIPAWTTFDGNLGYEFGENHRWLSGTRVAINVQNLTDKAPPIVLSGTNAPQVLNGSDAILPGPDSASVGASFCVPAKLPIKIGRNAMRQWSTATHEDVNHLVYWREAICEAIFELDFTSADPHVEARMQQHDLGPLKLSAISIGSAHSVRRMAGRSLWAPHRSGAGRYGSARQSPALQRDGRAGVGAYCRAPADRMGALLAALARGGGGACRQRTAQRVAIDQPAVGVGERRVHRAIDLARGIGGNRRQRRIDRQRRGVAGGLHRLERIVGADARQAAAVYR